MAGSYGEMSVSPSGVFMSVHPSGPLWIKLMVREKRSSHSFYCLTFMSICVESGFGLEIDR